MKNHLSKEQWEVRKAVKPLSAIVIRGIAHKSVAVHGEGKFSIYRAARHIAHRKVVRDGTTNHYRVQQGRGNKDYADINLQV